MEPGNPARLSAERDIRVSVSVSGQLCARRISSYARHRYTKLARMSIDQSYLGGPPKKRPRLDDWTPFADDEEPNERHVQSNDAGATDDLRAFLQARGQQPPSTHQKPPCKITPVFDYSAGGNRFGKELTRREIEIADKGNMPPMLEVDGRGNSIPRSSKPDGPLCTNTKKLLGGGRGGLNLHGGALVKVDNKLVLAYH